ncbi:hypothetical protein SB782_32920, partial [Brevibacillus sp. SIMBA_076]|uniref:hypothetical protein n=1 Tax=Brevibacillus sp. SIMBA_076 TaxID=3085814 RepID=UPI003979CBFD
MAGRASFRQVLDAVWDAWTARRDEVEADAGKVAAALAAAAEAATSVADLPDGRQLDAAIAQLAEAEDADF